MIKGKWRVIAPTCVNQDTGDRLELDDLIYELSEAEVGRLLAFGLIENIKNESKKSNRRKK